MKKQKGMVIIPVATLLSFGCSVGLDRSALICAQQPPQPAARIQPVPTAAVTVAGARRVVRADDNTDPCGFNTLLAQPAETPRDDAFSHPVQHDNYPVISFPLGGGHPATTISDDRDGSDPMRPSLFLGTA